ncbi:DEAD/DEAH box helicase [Bacillus cereus group sp. BfR-BA-01445]|uniref:DEAD/DEAH box helicase n=1 Tax=Bacillus cereus group sp. BfR-BA-01445 TaxID=2920349 RepID=UPI001F59F828|nr:DEAD/DEAH box helicase [Bacillus cereus group sp. BfR-BA-01445]
MSLNDIVSELDKEILLNLLKKLKKIEVQRDLFSTVTETISLTEIKILAECANILAMSSTPENKRQALEIAISLPQLNSSKGVYLSSFLALRKLGNFPAIQLLESKSGISEYKDLLDGVTALEEYIIESFNEKSFIDKQYLLTNFQKKVFEIVNGHQGISISAPTSAGKSFIVLNYILDLIYQERENITVIYIVPTRALIKQVMNDFIEHINESGLKNIYVGCSSEIENIAGNVGKSNILVLTQERLYQLCTKPDVNKLNVSMIVVDEAHNIQSGGRGVLLEGALKFVQEKFSNAKTLFASPLVSNPEKLLTTFNIMDGEKEEDSFPLVIQNIIKVKKLAKRIKINVIYQDEEIEVNEIPYEDKGTSRASILANVAIKLWNNQTSIIYSNEALLSTDVARILFESGQFPVLNDERLEDFAEFIEEYISTEYELAQFIRCGIAFHFGSLPMIIRAGIEELFKVGALKIVSCTSTLLEGLNMPAKNIFIYKPEKGRHNPMDKLNFWNLAGRAGRMGNDFSGNIICIDPESWKENPLLGERSFPIIPSSEYKLKNQVNDFKEYISDRKKPSGMDDYNEQLVSMVVRDRVQGKKLIDSPYKDENNEKDLIEIDEVTEIIINEFKPPLSLLRNTPGIMPDRINDLWEYFEKNKENYKEFMPIFPMYSKGKGYNRLKSIVKLINKFFMNRVQWSEGQIRRISINSHNWMLGIPLAEIIFYKESVKNYTHKQLTKYVKDKIEFLNKQVRYEMVKYTQVYIEVLRVFLESINQKEDAEKLVNLSLYLEYGACSTPALEFMAIGLPREAAIRLDKEFGINHKVEDPNYYLEWLKTLDVNTLEMPNYLKQQIVQIQKIF